MLAFLTAPAVTLAETPVADKPLPTFKPRWWYRHDRLDARPVIWSLKNRPEEWKLDGSAYTIIHTPSKHEFWIATGAMFAGLYRADCSCTSTRGKFQRGQAHAFMRAVNRWRRCHEFAHDLPEQFAAHFVR